MWDHIPPPAGGTPAEPAPNSNFCQQCKIHWPHQWGFQHCPRCKAELWGSHEQPDYTETETNSIRTRHRQFADFLVQRAAKVRSELNALLTPEECANYAALWRGAS